MALHYARVRIHIYKLYVEGVVRRIAAISDRRIAGDKASITGFISSENGLVIRTG